MKQNDTIIVKYPLYRIDPLTKIKKSSFIMNCSNCSVFYNDFTKCQKRGCQFQRLYKSLNPEISEEQKLRIMQIYMNGYYRCR